MEDKRIDQISELYNMLVELGVVFYYGGEIIPTGEITEIDFSHNNEVRIELNGIEEYVITFEDFQENHSKSGANYHNWEAIRHFDSLISNI